LIHWQMKQSIASISIHVKVRQRPSDPTVHR
jgi:hypothetical protein